MISRSSPPACACSRIRKTCRSSAATAKTRAGRCACRRPQRSGGSDCQKTFQDSDGCSQTLNGGYATAPRRRCVPCLPRSPRPRSDRDHALQRIRARRTHACARRDEAALMDFVVDGIQWSLLLYFVVLNAGYMVLNVLAFRELSRCMQTRALETLPQVYSGLEIPITLIVPAYNEESTIVDVGPVAAATELSGVRGPRRQRRLERSHARRDEARIRSRAGAGGVPGTRRVQACPRCLSIQDSPQPARDRQGERRRRRTRSTPASTARDTRCSAVSMPTPCSSATACIASCCPSSRTRERSPRAASSGCRTAATSRAASCAGRLAAQSARHHPGRRVPARVPVRAPWLVADERRAVHLRRLRPVSQRDRRSPPAASAPTRSARTWNW